MSIRLNLSDNVEFEPTNANDIKFNIIQDLSTPIILQQHKQIESLSIFTN